MFKSIVAVTAVIALLASLAGWTMVAMAQTLPRVAEQAKTADLAGSGWPDADAGYNQPIPPADMNDVLERAQANKARAALNRERVQSVIDYVKEHRQFPLRTMPFDAAQQVVIDYIRLNNRVPTSADQVGSPVQAVLDYIRVHHAMPPHPEPVDPAIQAVMDYIRVNGKVPTSAASVQ